MHFDLNKLNVMMGQSLEKDSGKKANEMDK